ncbi:MAG: SIS domain-containing protein [Patescibacteria group bacterium]
MSWTDGEIYSYQGNFIGAMHNIKVTDRNGDPLELAAGIKDAIEVICALKDDSGKLIFIGNGGSAAIASHQATDFIRTCDIPAFAPLDFTLLTCMGNDLGFENVFSKPLKILANPQDVLIAISSSGKSPNILSAVSAMREKELKIITLSGFGSDNPLRQLGDINFYVPSDSYRHVESLHLFVCNWLLDFTHKSMTK